MGDMSHVCVPDQGMSCASCVGRVESAVAALPGVTAVRANLAAANLGVATGTGTDVAIETADVVLMSGERKGVINAVRLSRATVRNIKENLGWAFGYNILLIPVAAGVLYPAFGLLLSPTLAALARAFSRVPVLWGFQSKTAVRSWRCTQTKAGQVPK